MPRLHLVRHGHAAASWTAHLDPDLDDVGRAQAVQTAARLHDELHPRPIVCSPLARTRQTAAPLAARWDTDVTIDAAVGEIPSPTSDPVERGAWLASVMLATWDDLDAEVQAWRERLLAAVTGFEADTVVVTHFVAINAIVGHAEGTDRVMAFAPENATVTIVDVDPSTRAIAVVERGSEATPNVG